MALSFSIDDLPHLLVLLVVAAVIGWFTDLFAGGHVPLGFLGSILFGVLGAWAATELVRPHLPFHLPAEPTFDGVLLVTAGVGAFVVSMLWCAFSSRIARNVR